MQHLDEGILQAWLDRPRSGLDPSEIARVERHLESCERCAAALEALRTGDERTRALLATGVDRDMPRPPFEEVVRRARGGGRTGGTRLRLSRMAWAASIVVALGVGWMTNEMVRSGAVPVGEPVQPATTRQLEAPRAPGADRSAEDASAVTQDAAAALPPESDPVDQDGRASQDAVADASPGTANDLAAGAGAPAPERTAAGRPDVASEPISTPPSRAVAPVERPELDASTLADLADEQMAIVQGVVRTVDGEPVQAAQVYVQNFTVGTLSDSAGSYTLLLPRSELDSTNVDVTATRIGFRTESQRVAVDGPEPAVADFGLQEEAIQLQEVIVTGTASAVQRRALGNTVATVEAVTVEEWRPATPEEAASHLGRPLVTSPGLDVLGVDVATDLRDDASLVRVRQDLGDGSVLTLVQGSAPSDREAWPLVPDGAVESTRVGELLVTATAPVSASFLRTLLAGLQ